MEINDLDFYQTDHTNASSWEAFNFNLEEVLANLRIHHDSKRNKDVKLGDCHWTTKKEVIRLQELPIEVTLHLAEPNESGSSDGQVLVHGSFSFPEDSHRNKGGDTPPLWMWYNLAAFIVVSGPNDDYVPEQQMKTLQSSIQMAVAEVNCSIPVFLRVMNRKANMFLGVSDDDLIRTNYDMIFLRALPPNYKHFTGLYDLFKGKVGLCPDPIEVAVRICFSTNELKDFTELGRKPEVEEIKYPFGIETDPIKFFVLNCVWPELPTSLVLHNFTNFEPAKAKDWILQCVSDDSPIEILADFLEEFADNLFNEDVILDESEYALNSKRIFAKHRFDLQYTEDASIPDEMVKKFLYYLFPDADSVEPREYRISEKASVRRISSLSWPFVIFCFPQAPLSKMKTGPKDCLIHRLALVLALAYNNFGNLNGLRYFWKEFFMELRYRVDNCIDIPG